MPPDQGKNGHQSALIRRAVMVLQVDETTGSHVKGCKCPKSRCIKKYCECFYANIRCSDLCK
jgi:hypothetical protein